MTLKTHTNQNWFWNVLTSILSKICGLCLKVRSVPGNQQIWLNSINSAKKTGQKFNQNSARSLLMLPKASD
ncbi:hypothetical protein LDENG_00164940 [Lucifuga dentata]|nr:hypothetical protein LDENG_00164940 [Lucifuga dentata]